MRWLHIYLSMIGLATLLFFSVTGITLNHPNWFSYGSERIDQQSGQIEPRWLNLVEFAGERPKQDDLTKVVDKFAVVEHLRKTHRIHGEVVDLRVDDRECMVSFKGPGYSAEATIQRDSGKYALTQSMHGFVAVINDLHKGRDTGPLWSVVIDASAILMTVVSFTGLILLFYIKRRRISGTVVTLIGTLVLAGLYWFGVP